MSDSTIRAAAVAGSFYPADPRSLRALVAECLDGPAERATAARGVVVPHAGLRYSGACAGAVFRRLTFTPVIVVLAPNHTGDGGAPGGASVWARGAFATPLGTVAVAETFADALLRRCRLVSHDPAAHVREHAIEVELPFVQTLAPDSTIVPLVLAWDDWARAAELAEALASVIAAWPEPVLLVASSDFTHYEPAGVAERKDRVALGAIERLDGEGLLAACRRDHITMCGRAPTAVMLEATRRLGARGGTVIDYRHSGMVTGDDDRVVGYGGVVVA